MARYNEILAGRFNRGLQKLTSIKGEPPSPQLSSEIQPVIPLHLGNEYRIYDSWDRYAVLITPGAVAAQFGIGKLTNPAGSNQIVVVEKISILPGATTGVNVLIQYSAVAAFTTVLTPIKLDTRNPRANSAIVPSQQAQVGSEGANIFAVPNVANVLFDVIADPIQEIVLGPNSEMHLTGTVVNASFTATLFWRERFLEDSERSI